MSLELYPYIAPLETQYAILLKQTHISNYSSQFEDKCFIKIVYFPMQIWYLDIWQLVLSRLDKG